MHPPRHRLGAGLALASFALFTLMDTLVKLLSAGLPPFQIGMFTSMFALPMVLLLGSGRARPGAPGFLARAADVARTRHPLFHLMRALVACCGGLCALHAYSIMPLTDAYALLFSAPLLITALSPWILGERVGTVRWLAVLAGFAGMAIMTRPGTGALSAAALLPLGGALCGAVSTLMVRRLDARDGGPTFAFYGSLAGFLVGAVMTAVSGFVPPAPEQLAGLALCGMLAGAASSGLMAAYRSAPASVVAPLQYTQLLWGALAGYVLWRDVPDLWLAAGAGLVMVSGLCAMQRERPRPVLLPARAAAAPAG